MFILKIREACTNNPKCSFWDLTKYSLFFSKGVIIFVIGKMAKYRKKPEKNFKYENLINTIYKSKGPEEISALAYLHTILSLKNAVDYSFKFWHICFRLLL